MRGLVAVRVTTDRSLSASLQLGRIKPSANGVNMTGAMLKFIVASARSLSR